MIRKLLGVGLTLVFLTGFATSAMAQAINFKFGGWFRYRGIVTDNQDRLDTVEGAAGDLGRDNFLFYDSVFRPTFTATMEDKARVFFQLDIPSFNQVGGDDGFQVGTGFAPETATGERGRTDVNVVVYNLQVKTPLVPFPWFWRFGRDNVFLPRGLVGRLPLLREFGIQTWATIGMFKPRVEVYKRDESASTSFGGRGLDFSDDDNVYVFKLPFTPMKGVRLMPYAVYWEQNRPNPIFSSAATIIWYPGLEADIRWRNFFGKLDFIYQTGDIYFNPSGEALGLVDQDVEAFVVWVQGGFTVGALTASANFVYASGDDDQTDSDQNQFFGVGCQFTDSAVGSRGCDARAQGPSDLWFGDKYHDIITAGSRNIGGNTGGTGGRYARGNGTRTFSLDAAYRALPNVLLQGTAAFIWSAESRCLPDTFTAPGAAGTACDTATPTFNDDEYIGTEIDVSATWTIYKGVSLSGGFGYLFAGDYGQLATPIAEGSQSPGGALRLVNENDDTWQAVWRVQWAF